ncbi:MAG: ATP-binding protein, partial [Actinomycetota bacterium]|nr:ATP-binding protein [Actinomycetota bacterium]
RATGGTGLGLSIVRHVAANHGGEILLQSREGEGSKFTIRLPEDLEE